MKTYPIVRDNGTLHAFEITSTWLSFGSLLKLLKSVPGVTDVKRNWFNDDRVSFKFHGKEAVVHEPWGDNNRYWVGFKVPDESQNLDITPLHEAFKHFQGFPVVTFWPFEQHDG